MREKEGDEGRSVASSSDISGFLQSEFVWPRIKARLLNEGYAPRGRDSSSFGYFHPNGHLTGFLACDKAALFRPYILSEIWDWFSVGKLREFGLVSFIKLIAAFVNLMLGF